MDIHGNAMAFPWAGRSIAILNHDISMMPRVAMVALSNAMQSLIELLAYKRAPLCPVMPMQWCMTWKVSWHCHHIRMVSCHGVLRWQWHEVPWHGQGGPCQRHGGPRQGHGGPWQCHDNAMACHGKAKKT